MSGSGISVGGSRRLRKAIEAEVRLEFKEELAAAAGFWQRQAIAKKIRKEVAKRMDQVASPYSLYSSLCFLRFGSEPKD